MVEGGDGDEDGKNWTQTMTPAHLATQWVGRVSTLVAKSEYQIWGVRDP